MSLFSKKEMPQDDLKAPKVLDNVHEKVVDDLRQTIRKGSKVSIAAASFSIYAFEALKKELNSVDEFRFLNHLRSPFFLLLSFPRTLFLRVLLQALYVFLTKRHFISAE